jgi:hypothetical protein
MVLGRLHPGRRRGDAARDNVGDCYGRKRLPVGSLALFTPPSAWCALWVAENGASPITTLIGRAIATVQPLLAALAASPG